MTTAKNSGFDLRYLDLLAAMEAIWDLGGKVCDHYEDCSHVACDSSYLAWSIADKVLCSDTSVFWNGTVSVSDYVTEMRNSFANIKDAPSVADFVLAPEFAKNDAHVIFERKIKT